MATDLENLKALRSNLIAQLLADATNPEGPQPSYSVLGESVSRTEWRADLRKSIGELTEQILAEEPFESRHQAL